MIDPFREREEEILSENGSRSFLQGMRVTDPLRG